MCLWSRSALQGGARLLGRTVWLALLGLLAIGAAAQTELTTVRQIRALTPEQAGESRPVHLRGQVTVLPAYKNSFFFLDETGGISIDRDQTEPALKPGLQVDIHGVTAPGLFAPSVTAGQVRIAGEAPLPPAPLMHLDDLAGGQKDSQWLTIQGLVRSASVQTKWDRPMLVLEMDLGAGNLIVVHLYDFSQGDWKRLAGALVRLRGVCGTIFGDRRQFVGLRFFVASLQDLTVVKAAPADPFDLPLLSINKILRFADNQGTIQRVKVHGFVTYCTPGHGLYIQDGNQGIFVRSRQLTPLQLGTELEVTGYPVAGRYSPYLDDALYRVLAIRKPLEAVPVRAGKMIEVSPAGFYTAPYDALVVRIQGKLLEELSSPEEDRFILQVDNQVFPVRLLGVKRSYLELTPGMVLQATGICVAQANEEHEAHGFEILVRTAEDIVVLSRPPWWNAKRAGWLVALCLIVIFMLGAIWAIRRRHRELRALAMTDPLTGLYNRRAFFLLAEHQWQSSLRRKTPLLLFYLDIDHFKQINDTLGHKAGDQALMALAEILRECFRGTDIIARMGGDEFAVLFDAGSKSLLLIGERLDAAVSKANNTTGRQFRLSLSVGTLVCDESLGELSMDELVSRADALMYREKQLRKQLA